MTLEKNPRHNNFDLLRLLAAIQVMVCHSIEHLKLSLNYYVLELLYAFPGVPIFFCISGFLITRSYIENKGNLKRFFFNRALRIYPGLWINMLIIFGLLTFTGAVHLETLFQGIELLFFQCLQFLTGITLHTNPLTGKSLYDFTLFYNTIPSGVFWTITVELSFYLLVPCIFRYKRLNQTRNFVLIFTGMLPVSFIFAGINSYLNLHGPTLIYHLSMSLVLPHLWIFLFAGGVYVCWHNLARFFEGKILYWLTLYLAFTLYAHQGSLDFQILNPVTVIRVLLLSCTTLSFAFSLKNLSSQVLKHNDFSYGIYLWHMPVIATFAGLRFEATNYLFIPVCCTTLTLAAWSWFFIEKPALQLKQTEEKNAPFFRVAGRC